jgi:hypothetical protein
MFSAQPTVEQVLKRIRERFSSHAAVESQLATLRECLLAPPRLYRALGRAGKGSFPSFEVLRNVKLSLVPVEGTAAYAKAEGLELRSLLAALNLKGRSKFTKLVDLSAQEFQAETGVPAGTEAAWWDDGARYIKAVFTLKDKGELHVAVQIPASYPQGVCWCGVPSTAHVVLAVLPIAHVRLVRLGKPIQFSGLAAAADKQASELRCRWTDCAHVTSTGTSGGDGAAGACKRVR